jgi:pimeloyl-ACP methyl ester carboxylesterase
MTPPEQAEYLSHFRADSIVRDAELVRRALEVDRWSVLGQSFGGFCVLAYLSFAPAGLREAFFTGGLPPLRCSIGEVYARTYERVLERNRRFYERFPEDRERVRRLRAAIEDGGIGLPGGDQLSWRRVRQLGSMLGMSDGAERLHYILELPFDSPAFLHDVAGAVGFARNPLYAIVHEAWPFLYEPAALAANEVPCAAAIYTEDMYVERAFSEETAARIHGIRTWVTSEYDHNGLRADGVRVLGHLFDLVRGRA